MKKFIMQVEKDKVMNGVILGDEVQAEDGTDIIITQIVRINLEKDYIVIIGYGIDVNYKPEDISDEIEDKKGIDK